MANILILSIISLFNSLHPIHISVTEIEHDADSKNLEITMRIFIDDLETAIRKEINQPQMDITQPGEGYDTDQLMEEYLRKHFKMNINGKDFDFQYLGHEIELPVVFIYLQTEKIKKIKEISIFNDIITESYEDQANLVHIEANDETRSLKLTQDNKKDQLTY